MKNLLLVFILACGLKPLSPLPPLGCDSFKAFCVCDDMARCEWIWICTDDFKGAFNDE